VVKRRWDNSFKARLLCKTYLFWHAVSLLNFVLIEEQHAHGGLPRGFWWFSGPGEGLRVVLRVCPGLGDLGFWAYVVQFIAVGLLASVQAMKQWKFPAPIVILFVEIGLYVVWFFARLGGAVEVILRENMKPQLGDIALPRKADRISKAEECYQSIGLQQTLAMGVSSTSIFQQPVRD